MGTYVERPNVPEWGDHTDFESCASVSGKREGLPEVLIEEADPDLRVVRQEGSTR